MKAATGKKGKQLYMPLRRVLTDAAGVTRVATGVFRADMQVELVNDGPVTILIDSRKQF